MNWKHIPLALRVALCLTVAIFVTHVVLLLGEPKDYKLVMRISLATSSFRFGANVLFALGLVDLAKPLVGRARTGVQIAFACAVFDVLHGFAWAAISSKQSWIESSTLRDVMLYSSWISSVLLLVGLAIAALDRVAVAAVGFVAALVLTQPPFLMKRLVEWLSLEYRGRNFVLVALSLAQVVVSLVMLFVIARPPAAPEPELAQVGFRRAAASLWWRVIAVAAVPALMLLAIVGKSSGEGGAKVLAYTMLCAAILQIGSLAWYGVGAITVARARLVDMRALPLYVAGVSALACAGLQLAQTSLLVRLMFRDPEYGGGGGYLQEELQVWSIAAPLVAILALVAFAAGIAGFAGRRCFNDLHSEATGKGMGAGALMLVPLAVMQWLLPGAKSEGSLLFMLLAALTCAVMGTVMMAKLCTIAADAIDREPSLPTAKIV